jgi:YD repeat-containing protein
VVELEYDKAGYKKRASDGGVITEYNIEAGQYVPDPYGRINVERTLLGGDTYTVAYQYDVTGRVIGVRSPSGDWASYQYNQMSELLLVPGFINQEVQYDEVGRLASAATANGLTAAWQYDLNGRLIHKEVSDTDSTVKQYSFGYDRANNVLWKNDTRYEYDELNRVARD